MTAPQMSPQRRLPSHMDMRLQLASPAAQILCLQALGDVDASQIVLTISILLLLVL